MATALTTQQKADLNDLWWLWIVRSLVLVFFGIFAAVWPGLTLALVAVAFALLLLVSGVVDLISGVRGAGKRNLWFLTTLLGVLEVGLGVYLIRHGVDALAVLIALIGIGLIVRGILEIVAAFEFHYSGGVKFLTAAIGVLAVLAGGIVLAHPVSGGVTFVWVLGVYGILAGAVGVAMALGARKELA
ncbi:MAG TPA: DUF308 domain-containing protein [Patescibacteria group bacterium]|jgi:uncharacterized membrane protein HdeD (DUF308 family)